MTSTFLHFLEESRKDITLRIEDSTINLIRSEKMFLETARIVAGIVDDIASDTEDENEVGEDGEIDGILSAKKANHNWDKLMPMLPGPDEMLATKAKMAAVSVLFVIKPNSYENDF